MLSALRTGRQIKIDNVFWTQDINDKKTKSFHKQGLTYPMDLISKLANIVVEMPNDVKRLLKQENSNFGKFSKRLGTANYLNEDKEVVFDGQALKQRSKRKWWQSNNRKKYLKRPQIPTFVQEDYDYDFIPSMKSFEDYYKGYYNKELPFYLKPKDDKLKNKMTTLAPYIETLKKVTNQEFTSQSFDDLVNNHKHLIEGSIQKLKSTSSLNAEKKKRNSGKSKSKSEMKTVKSNQVKILEQKIEKSFSNHPSGENGTAVSKIKVL